MGWVVAGVLAVVLLILVVVLRRRGEAALPASHASRGVRLGLPAGPAAKRLEEVIQWSQNQHRFTKEMQDQLITALHAIRDHGIWHKTFRERMNGFEDRLSKLEHDAGPEQEGESH
jgi:hypothetical protein